MAAPRRSTRIRNLDLGLTAESDKPIPVETRNNKRLRVPEGINGQREVISVEKKKIVGEKEVPVKEKDKMDEATTESIVGNGKPQEEPNALTRLPAEILQPILESVDDPPSMVKLACTSKKLYQLVMPILHKRVSVSVHFWAHIPHVIRQLEPHLSIAQKRQLKREGKYKGQQERFSSRLDPSVVPACADYVRQMVIGSIDPGKKHKTIVLRYLEEVLKNVHNLEVLDTMELTESMAQSIAAKTSLKALRLYANDDWATSTDVSSLANIGGLEHISITNSNFGGALLSSKEKLLQSILLNSLSTLKSLEVLTSKYYSDFLADWNDQIKARDPDAMQNAHDFTALRSLCLSGIQFMGQFCGNVMPSLTRAIDFVQLRELTLMELNEGKVAFYKHLEDTFRAADKGTIQLRKLNVQMKKERGIDSHATTEYQLEGIYRFISSFDTLTSLKISDYNQYNNAVETNSGLSRRLLQVILNHKGLKTLRFSYRFPNGAFEPPFLDANTVRLLVKNLPVLRIFEFAPREDDLNATARALSRGAKIESLEFSAFPSQSDYTQKIHPALSFTKRMSEAFLETAIMDEDDEEFVWEHHYRLTKMVTLNNTYAVGSELKPRSDLLEGPVTVVMGDRAVVVQDLRRKRSATHYYTADSRWSHQVAKLNSRHRC